MAGVGHHPDGRHRVAVTTWWKLLLAIYRIDADIKDHYGRAPLSFAARNGQDNGCIGVVHEEDDQNVSSSAHYTRKEQVPAPSKV